MRGGTFSPWTLFWFGIAWAAILGLLFLEVADRLTLERPVSVPIRTRPP
jgi:hypothetical protein